MTRPVLLRQSFLIAIMTGAQSLAPWFVAMGVLYGLMRYFGLPFNPSSMVIMVLAVLCLISVEPPRDVTRQLTSASLPTAASIGARWLLLLIGLAIVNYFVAIFAMFPPRLVWTWIFITPVAQIGVSLLTQSLMRRLLLLASQRRTAVFAGYNSASLNLAQKIREAPALCLNIVGFFDDRSADRLGLHPEAALKGRLADIIAYVNKWRIDVIFIALPIGHVQRVVQLLDRLGDTTASIYYAPDIFIYDLTQAHAANIQGVPVVAMCESPFFGYRGVAKRVMDVLVAIGMVVALLPLLLVIAAMVKVSSPGPVIFTQRRYGIDGREIAIYKFRSMTVTEDGAHIRQASKSDSRTTQVGRILRRFSMDELPQLFNVLQGRMSLVGPRPHAVAHNEQYRKLIKGYMVRHKVLPGITGLAQVNGCRGETTNVADMEARLRYDLDYLRQWTPLLDLKILLLTVTKVFRDSKAY